MNYCKHLPHIPGQALGLNFDIIVKSNKYKNHFQTTLPDLSSKLTNLIFKLPLENKSATINLNIEQDEQAIISFNFNYEFRNTPLGKINLDFKKEWDRCVKDAEVFISQIEKNNLIKAG
ncbi:hypothetical protein [Leptospira interrogans]|uniref:hypothetical protein n=1 Tax=Leptospira interrogans TaxID=173 RepID=UPI000773922E|nr:hypothetical protein [Leptospira interrogans]